MKKEILATSKASAEPVPQNSPLIRIELKELNLSNNSFSGSRWQQLMASVFRQQAHSLEVLVLQHCHLDNTKVRRLLNGVFFGLLVNPGVPQRQTDYKFAALVQDCALIKCDFSFNKNIDAEGWELLAREFYQISKSVRELRLEACDLDDLKLKCVLKAVQGALSDHQKREASAQGAPLDPHKREASAQGAPLDPQKREASVQGAPPDPQKLEAAVQGALPDHQKREAAV